MEYTMSGDLKIGELAQTVGVSRDTIRYYERLKLLPKASRTESDYRLYTAADVERLRFIKQAQSFGFSLDEIRALLPTGKTGLQECQSVRDLLDAKLKELDAHLAQMHGFREKLAEYFAACEEALSRRDRDTCPVLFELSHSSSSARPANNHRKKKGEKQ
jgi:MerR family transcriptional regulator, copper efflux regulator